MEKLDFIARQLSRARNKKFEHYVITRIWHLLNDTDIKIITQQYIRRPDGRVALTDLYLPQFKIHIEVDERQHFDENNEQKLADIIREADIISVTNHEFKRIKAKDATLEGINTEIDELVAYLREIKNSITDFNPWDFKAETNPDTYIKRGFIDLKDDVAFRTMVDAANCFGNNYSPKAIWTAGAKHPKEQGKIIWFPKLYENGEWNNSINDLENQIIEINKDPKKAKDHIKKSLEKKEEKRIVFARVKSPLGDVMYRFKGEFEIDLEKTNYRNGVVFRRVSERVKTYSPGG